jgi:hypothetical protein
MEYSCCNQLVTEQIRSSERPTRTAMDLGDLSLTQAQRPDATNDGDSAKPLIDNGANSAEVRWA